jgi:SEC-C motif-containing protein
MRSRFTAYALRDAAYIARTWATSTHPHDLTLPTGVVWRDLEILRVEAGGEADAGGLVEFVAHCVVDGQTRALHEASRFTREYDEWRYLDGETPRTVKRQVPKVGRNAACPCGSGKKFKQCCGQRA